VRVNRSRHVGCFSHVPYPVLHFKSYTVGCSAPTRGEKPTPTPLRGRGLERIAAGMLLLRGCYVINLLHFTDLLTHPVGFADTPLKLIITHIYPVWTQEEVFGIDQNDKKE
jgi:hypothetical protein